MEVKNTTYVAIVVVIADLTVLPTAAAYASVFLPLSK